MMHDFAITENFVVIPDQQVVFKLQEMVIGGSPVVYDKKKKSHFGILAKNAQNASDIIWVESPDTFFFHLWNAWEEHETNETNLANLALQSISEGVSTRFTILRIWDTILSNPFGIQIYHQYQVVSFTRYIASDMLCNATLCEKKTNEW
ncbi:hypothetical protein K1719_028055 [Acacia pycnantha]|nr:hypothetical protein K1719_028055 [Acacia pycnantha]